MQSIVFRLASRRCTPQPLSAIEAIAYYLHKALPEDQREAREYLLRLQELVEASGIILSDAVKAARLS